MPAPTKKQLQAEKHIERAVQTLPYYVHEFVRAKKRARHSPETLSGYLRDYTRFFNWLIEEGLTTEKDPRMVPYSVLEGIKKKDIEFFFERLMDEPIQKAEGVYSARSEASLNRYIQSLKSLFNYLTIESENDEGECYFYRNVMAKIKTPKKSESAAYRAKRIASNLINEQEMIDFIRYLEEVHYAKTETSRSGQPHLKNKRRDIAIISLLLGSGIRVKEIAGLLIQDIDFVKGDIRILRKGNKVDVVSVKRSAMNELEKYLNVRHTLYKPDEKNQFVFLTLYAGKANPMTIRAVQKLVERTSEKFLKGKRLSPHKLRDSFANHWMEHGGSLVGLRDQLGHNSIETTVLYTNLSQEEQRKMLDKMDKTKEAPNN